VAAKFAPNDRLTLTPRLVYQQVKADGWNRIDSFNILANPYTTTRPAVSLGEREQFRQIGEPYDDKFTLADLNIGYRFDSFTLTSITSYTHRTVDVVRDAGALTSSITGGSVGSPSPCTRSTRRSTTSPTPPSPSRRRSASPAARASSSG
jgi:iron complex outermembrane receptor protein